MAIKIKSGNGPVLRAPQRSDFRGDVEYNAVSVHIAGGTATQETQQDAVFNVYTEATYHHEGNVLIRVLGGVEIQNLDPTVGTVTSDGTITRLSSGILRLHIKTPLITIPLNLDLRDKTEKTDRPKIFISTVSNSLAEHLQQQVDNRLAAIAGTPTMADNGFVFTTQNHSTQTYVRNPDLWCSQGTPVDLTCASPWNSNGGVRKAGTLVTPRHAVNAEHYPLPVGAVMRFVAADGTVHDRTIIGRKLHADRRDAAVYTLDSDLPAAISPCKVLPSNFQDYMPEANMLFNRPPLLALDQQERALMYEYLGLSWDDSGSYYRPSETGDRAIFGRLATTGDSGNPLFLLVNGEPIFISVFGSPGGGVSITSDAVNITQMIVDADTQAGVSGVADSTWPNAGGHYQVKEADFSAFPNYA